MSIFENCEPKNVLHYFEKLCSIPRGSGNCGNVATWLETFAYSHGLKVIRDKSNNVIIFKEASRGREALAPLILQAHTDMVCEKESGSNINFDTDPINIIVECDVVRAKSTTLGADNGIGVALILAILADDNLVHPKIEAVFTSDEEIGMVGASALDVSVLKGTRMINLDSEDEEVFIVGCAGGNVTKNTIPIARDDFEGKYYELRIAGLTGGHSGADIDKYRANSNVLMGRLLLAISKSTQMRLGSINGGNKDNVIASDTSAVIAITDEIALNNILTQMRAAFLNEYKLTDPHMTISVSGVGKTPVMSEESTRKIVFLLALSPDGIQSMSSDIEGLVQSSLNLGILKTTDNNVEFSHCVRSSLETQKQMICDRLCALCSNLGGHSEIDGDYPAWEYEPDSELRELMAEIYKKQRGSEPKLSAIHAGLECGLFTAMIPNLDCVSCGPNLADIHTPRERFYISSVKNLWDMLVETLKMLK